MEFTGLRSAGGKLEYRFGYYGILIVHFYSELDFICSDILLCVFCRAKGSVVTFSSGVTTNQLLGPGLIYFLLLKPPFSVFSSYASTLSYILQ